MADKQNLKCAVICVDEKGIINLMPISSLESAQKQFELKDFAKLDEVFLTMKEYVNEITKAQEANLIANVVIESLMRAFADAQSQKTASPIDLSGGHIDISSPKIDSIIEGVKQ